MTTEAVIVSTARTPIGKAYRGAFNDTDAPSMAGHAIAAAVERAGIEPGEVDDVVMGCAMQQGSTGQNIGRTAGSGRRPAFLRGGHEHRPAMRFRHDGDRHRRQADCQRRHADRGRRRRRIDQPRAERTSQRLPGPGPASPLPFGTRIHVHAGNRRSRFEALRLSAANNRTNSPCKASSAPPPPSRRAGSTTKSCRCRPPCCTRTRKPSSRASMRSRWTRTKATGPRPRWKGWAACARCSKAASSPPATPASCPTAPRPRY